LTVYKTESGEVELTIDLVRTLAIGDKITDKEAMTFINLCKYQKLNPFLKEAYIQKWGNKLSITVSKDTFTKRAAAHPLFSGYKAGIVVLNKSDIVYREGSMVLPDEKLVGGWCEVYVKGYQVPIRDEVSIKEYSTGKSSWATMPATMIRKVALVHALREAFPTDFQGLYDSAEMKVEIPEDDKIIDVEYESYITKEQAIELYNLAGDNMLFKMTLCQFGYDKSSMIKQSDFEAIKGCIEVAKNADDSDAEDDLDAMDKPFLDMPDGKDASEF
jgi:phage recombination protein Bet